jgi:uncharacterized protein
MILTYIFDACALIALMHDEDGSEIVETKLEKAMKGEIEIFMNKLNLLEIYYGLYREEGIETAEEIYNRISMLPITIIDILEDDVFKIAGRIKATYKLSLADSIVIGEAAAKSGIVVTCDHHEFDIVEYNESIEFEWIR